ncbi:cardiolipin synthase [Coraliomargarita sp. SDUM461004]|uniref:Cardiolipin synthase n=1 Tax=Thalassobacterium sedimentorum TaxID=3041258 RepID=A0ABU1AJ95_9BACT|nr:cardiolipin synthase [Coraliomargarita sp. SDUM461004]MDQ8194889.1 cardiolipin synthase [Coraliomargarita sp. SDUM461004]
MSLITKKDNPQKSSKRSRKSILFWSTLCCFHMIGFFMSINALMSVRTPQGTTAWVLALNTVPFIAVPSYLVFGEVDFKQYIDEKKIYTEQIAPTVARLRTTLDQKGLLAQNFKGSADLLATLLPLPPTTGNTAELLPDGPKAFTSIFDGISAAKDYVLVQFFTISDGQVGAELSERLIERANSGVRCYIIYDDMGTKVSNDYLKPLREAGVQLVRFNIVPQWTKLFRLNFRNHRKLVIVDGNSAWTGGMNIKYDYMQWRDTMVRINGPAVQTMQVSFLRDWAWSRNEMLTGLNWNPRSESGSSDGIRVASLPSSPTDGFERYTLFLLDVIHHAKERLWIASPYFVPDDVILRALQAAALRGVEVKVLIPDETDTMIARLAQFAAWSYIRELEAAGAEMYQYTSPFMHQKVILTDDNFCMIGSANFDNRSFRLNFELNAVINDPTFNAEVANMLRQDFINATPIHQSDLDGQGFWERVRIRASRLAAPVL